MVTAGLQRLRTMDDPAAIVLSIGCGPRLHTEQEPMFIAQAIHDSCCGEEQTTMQEIGLGIAEHLLSMWDSLPLHPARILLPSC